MTATLRTAAVLLGALMLAAGAAAAADEFPYRAEYADCATIDTHDLAARLDAGDVVVVDVRSGIEYDVIHVDGAVHVPVSVKTFADDARALAARHPGKALVFYCNGVTCLKSYKAAQAARAAGLTDVLAYDAGIPAWAKLYPARILLLGKPVTDPDTQIIAKAAFKEHCLPFDEFQRRAAAADALVIDVREPVQRGEQLQGVGAPRAIPLDVFIPNFVAKGEGKDRTLLIFDQVGKQVNWLMYYLEDQGYGNYWFLDGGVFGVTNDQKYRS